MKLRKNHILRLPIALLFIVAALQWSFHVYEHAVPEHHPDCPLCLHSNVLQQAQPGLTECATLRTPPVIILDEIAVRQISRPVVEYGPSQPRAPPRGVLPR